jgi:microcystin-dependent protein
MTNYYLGQIGIYGFNFAPRGWAFAAGQILPLAQNTALYSLLGTTFGGNGQTTFGLPDLRSRVPMGQGSNTTMGEMGGTETVTLLNSQMPTHTHTFGATNQNGNINGDGAHIFALGMGGSPPSPANTYLSGGAPNVVLNPAAISFAGGNQPHNNIQPSLGVNFCIATTGYYPARN